MYSLYCLYVIDIFDYATTYLKKALSLLEQFPSAQHQIKLDLQEKENLSTRTCWWVLAGNSSIILSKKESWKQLTWVFRWGKKLLHTGLIFPFMVFRHGRWRICFSLIDLWEQGFGIGIPFFPKIWNVNGISGLDVITISLPLEWIPCCTWYDKTGFLGMLWGFVGPMSSWSV